MPICSLYVELISLRLENQLTNDWVKVSLREKCPNTEFFLVRMPENMDQKNSVFGHFSRSVHIWVSYKKEGQQ